MGAAIVGIKLGSRGVYLRTGTRERLFEAGRGQPTDAAAWADRELWFPVYEISEFAGATGAGDTTIAGLLAGLLRGNDPVTAGTMANAVGACNVQAPDALSGLCSWEETRALVEAGWRQVPLDVGAPGWRQHPETGVWVGPGDPMG